MDTPNHNMLRSTRNLGSINHIREEDHSMHSKIKKRDGRLVKFNAEKITNAIAKAGAATGDFDTAVSKMLTIRVLNHRGRGPPLISLSEDGKGLYYLS
jgi:hypothetical protein